MVDDAGLLLFVACIIDTVVELTTLADNSVGGNGVTNLEQVDGFGDVSFEEVFSGVFNAHLSLFSPVGGGFGRVFKVPHSPATTKCTTLLASESCLAEDVASRCHGS